MAIRGYGQYCGLSRALEVLGERWGLLIVRDLFSGPHRFGELEHSLAPIPTSVLATRLKDLEEAGIVERVPVTIPRRGTAYTLTEDGRALEPTLVALGRWGAERMGDPRPGESVTAESLAMALRTTYTPPGAMEGAIELHLADIVLGILIDGEGLHLAPGPLADPPTVLRVTPDIKRLIAGELTREEAQAQGIVDVEGDPVGLDLFAAAFTLGA